MRTSYSYHRLSPSVHAAAALTAVWLLAAAAGAIAQTSETDTPRERVPVVYIELDQYGFRPDAVTVKPGKYMLIVRNCSARKDVDFRLDRSGGGTMKAHRLDQGKPRYKEVLEFAAGDYVLTAQHDKLQTLRLMVR